MNLRRLFKRHGTVIRAAFGFVLLLTALIFFGDNKIASYILCAAGMLAAGYDVIWEAISNILRGDLFDENFLMCIAAIGAFFIGEAHEAAAVMIFYQVGEYFQNRAVGKSRNSIKALMDIRPEVAHVLRDGEIVDVDPQELSVGEIIHIHPGERVPIDAQVTEGESWLDTSALSGESVPRRVEVGSAIFGGSVNTQGLLTACVTKPFGESAVSRMLEMVETAADKKAKTENFITAFARWYTPLVVGVAAALVLIPPIFVGNFSDWLYRALVFLVVSCPCALVISVPLGFFGGIGGAAKCGILVKGGNFFETLCKVDTVLMDKTGTLTRGSFDVQQVVPEGMSEEELLQLTAHTEMVSPHPMAKAIREAYGKDIDESIVTDVQEQAGHGAQAYVNGKLVQAGKRSWIEEICGKTLPVLFDSAVYVAVDGVYCGYIVVSDRIKDDAKAAIESLKASGVKQTVMLTGDTDAIAQRVAKALCIDQVFSELLPDQKVLQAERIMADGHITAFVGDGVNDAPLLARADVGIAMGALGSDAAIEAADIVIMDDKPSKIAQAIALAKKTMSIVKMNVVFSLAVKFAVLILAAFGVVGMWTAVFADVGVAMIAILNSMRTLQFGKN